MEKCLPLNNKIKKDLKEFDVDTIDDTTPRTLWTGTIPSLRIDRQEVVDRKIQINHLPGGVTITKKFANVHIQIKDKSFAVALVQTDVEFGHEMILNALMLSREKRKNTYLVRIP